MAASLMPLLLSATIEDGFMQLSLPRTELQALTIELRTQLVNNEISHYRVCGVSIENSRTFRDVVTRATAVGCSFSELTTSLANIVVADKGKNQANRLANFAIGSYASVCGRRTVTTSNLFYDGEGQNAIVPTLVKDKKICKFDSDAGMLILMLRRGNGLWDYTQAQGVVEKVGALPVRCNYTLNDFVAIQMPNENIKDGIKFHAKMDIDWEVLTKIIHDHVVDTTKIVGGIGE